MRSFIQINNISIFILKVISLYIHKKESIRKSYKTAFRFANNKIIHLWSSVQNFNMN